MFSAGAAASAGVSVVRAVAVVAAAAAAAAAACAAAAVAAAGVAAAVAWGCRWCSSWMCCFFPNADNAVVCDTVQVLELLAATFIQHGIRYGCVAVLVLSNTMWFRGCLFVVPRASRFYRRFEDF